MRFTCFLFIIQYHVTLEYVFSEIFGDKFIQEILLRIRNTFIIALSFLSVKNTLLVPKFRGTFRVHREIFLEGMLKFKSTYRMNECLLYIFLVKALSVQKKWEGGTLFPQTIVNLGVKLIE